MSTDAVKTQLYQSLAKVAQALANGNRLQLLEFMAQGERSVEALAELTGMTLANTSQHLQGLRQAGLVSPRKEGQRVYYRLAGDDVVHHYDLLRSVAESRLAEVKQLVADFLGDKDRSTHAFGNCSSGPETVTVLDVRPPGIAAGTAGAVISRRSWKAAWRNCRKSARWSPIAADRIA
jgi:DNA-binding transcriptional ArsR family regulator